MVRKALQLNLLVSYVGAKFCKKVAHVVVPGLSNSAKHNFMSMGAKPYKMSCIGSKQKFSMQLKQSKASKGLIPLTPSLGKLWVLRFYCAVDDRISNIDL